jgi:type IV secretion system protein TrbL
MCSAWNPICDIGQVLGGLGGTVAKSVFDEVASAFASAAQQLTSWMWTVIANTTTVDLHGSWFSSTLGVTATLAGLVITALFALELIRAVLRRDQHALSRAIVGAGAGILGAAASIGVVIALLSATDALSNGVVHTAGMQSIGTLGQEVAPTAALSTIGSPALMLILAVGYLVASFFVWAMFIFRKAMLIVAAVFAPIAFAGAPMRATSGWVRRWVEFTVTMIFSKVVVVILFTLAVSLVGSPGSGFAAVGNLFSGLALLVIACFAPWLLFRLVHFVGGDVMSAHHQSLAQSTVQAGSTPTSLARNGAMRIASIAAPSGATGGARAGSGAAGLDAAGASSAPISVGARIGPATTELSGASGPSGQSNSEGLEPPMRAPLEPPSPPKGGHNGAAPTPRHPDNNGHLT